MRENTEWTETLDMGANRLADCVPQKIKTAAQDALVSARRSPLPFAEGQAAKKL